MKGLSLGDTRIVDKKEPALVNTLSQEISAAEIDHSDIQQKVFKVMKSTRRREFEPLHNLIDELEEARILNNFVGDGAENAKKLAEKKALEFTEKHSDSLDEKTKSKIVTKEAKEAFDNHLTGRLAGKENNDWCDTPGIKVYVTKEGLQRVEELLDEYGITDIKKRRNDIFVINLPKGVYSMGFGGCQIHADSKGDRRDEVSSKAFNFLYDQVIRLESDSGKMWQNVNLDLSGKEKNPQINEAE